MTADALNGTAASDAPTSADIVVAFLEALEHGDHDTARDLLTDDAVWINVSLPAVRGADRIESVGRFLLDRLRMRFRVVIHNIAIAEENVVLTERTDALGVGRVEQRFWVYGRFELRDGKIAVWRDSFDWGDMVVSLVRALAGAVVPALNRRWPGDA